MYTQNMYLTRKQIDVTIEDEEFDGYNNGQTDCTRDEIRICGRTNMNMTYEKSAKQTYRQIFELYL